MNNFLLYLQMTSNLVNFTSCSTSGSSASEASEVNNNNDKFTLETSLSSSKDDEHNEEPTIQPSHSVYTLNDDRRILVNSPEEWLCVARLPLDFTQTEFESLLQDFGPLHTCFLIHSEISGTSKISPYPMLPSPNLDDKLLLKYSNEIRGRSRACWKDYNYLLKKVYEAISQTKPFMMNMMNEEV